MESKNGIELLFKLLRAEIAKSGMQPLPIVEHFNVHRCACLGAGGEETLLHGVVVAVAHAAQAEGDVLRLQQRLVSIAGVLAALSRIAFSRFSRRSSASSSV